MPEMREYRYDPRTTLGPTYLRETYRQERSRDAGIAHATGEQVIYSTLILTAAILTLGGAAALVRKINK